MEGNKKGPKFRVDCGGITASLWEVDGATNGTDRPLRSVSLDRRYKDSTGNWKSSTSFRESDLPKAILALQKIQEHLLVREKHDSVSLDTFGQSVESSTE